jgi:hypothetical protein
MVKVTSHLLPSIVVNDSAWILTSEELILCFWVGTIFTIMLVGINFLPKIILIYFNWKYFYKLECEQQQVFFITIRLDDTS